jgi:hypothetical protein
MQAELVDGADVRQGVLREDEAASVAEFFRGRDRDDVIVRGR